MIINIFAGVVLALFSIVAVGIYLEMKKDDKEIMRLAEESKKYGLRFWFFCLL